MNLYDQISQTQDRRRMDSLLVLGTISHRDLAEAPIIMLKQNCVCDGAEPDKYNRCINCQTQYSELPE